MKKGASLLVEIGWFGFGLVGGPLGLVLCMGPLSVQFVPFLISQKFKEFFDKLK